MTTTLFQRLRHSVAAAVIATVTTLAIALPPSAQAHSDPSAASAGSSLVLSALPLASVAVVASASVAVGASAVTAVSTVLSTAAQWTVLSVQASAEGTLWLLERAVDGARISVSLAAGSVRTTAIASGQILMVQPVYGGWLLGQDGIALAWVPAPDAAELSFHQRLR